MEKVDLNKERCIGCGACMSVAPDNFTFGDDGRAELIDNKITDEAIEASEMCPVSAIIIEGCSCDSCNCGDNCNCEDNCTCGEECTCGENCTCGEECTCGDECDCTEENNCGCK